MPDRATSQAVELVDGEDRACGELLMVLAARARVLAPGTRIRLIATDPAAAVDLPAWCHLTGHHFIASGRQSDDRAHYDLKTCESPVRTQPNDPWRREATRVSTAPPQQKEPSS